MWEGYTGTRVQRTVNIILLFELYSVAFKDPKKFLRKDDI